MKSGRFDSCSLRFAFWRGRRGCGSDALDAALLELFHLRSIATNLDSSWVAFGVIATIPRLRSMRPAIAPSAANSSHAPSHLTMPVMGPPSKAPMIKPGNHMATSISAKRRNYGAQNLGLRGRSSDLLTGCHADSREELRRVTKLSRLRANRLSHNPDSAIGITGTGVRSTILFTPRGTLRYRHRREPAFREDAHELATFEGICDGLVGALQHLRVFPGRGDRDRRAVWKKKLNSGTRKMLWSITHRIGRGHAAESTMRRLKET